MEKMGSALQRQLENFRNLAKTAAPQKAEVIHLPVWRDQQRGVAKVCLRSALFAAIHGNRRKAMQRELLASQNGIAIRFTGLQLDQSDLDVWEQALHLARQHPLGTQCEFTAHVFLKSLDRHTGKSQHEWLKGVFPRLSSAVVEITRGERETYFGHLIDEGARDEITGRYVLQLNPKLAALYAEGWTAIDWKQRRRLQRKPLALWLHGFLATHAKPFPMKVETLQHLSGSLTKEKRKVKNLAASCEASGLPNQPERSKLRRMYPAAIQAEPESRAGGTVRRGHHRQPPLRG